MAYTTPLTNAELKVIRDTLHWSLDIVKTQSLYDPNGKQCFTEFLEMIKRAEVCLARLDGKVMKII
jgi:hypothetical protein